MKRSTTLLAAGLAAAAALLAGCGGDGRPAASVNGVDIAQSDVVDELEAIEGNDTYVAAYDEAAAQSGQPPVRGTEEGTFDAGFVSTSLSIRIQYAIVESEIDRRDLDIPGECRDAARQLVVERFAGASPEGDGEAVLRAFGDTYAGYLVDREADLLALQADLAGQPCAAEPGDDVVEAYFEDHRDEFAVAQSCVSHILVATQAEADAIALELAAGADFATLAGQRSTDPGSAAQGGDLGCGPAGQYVPEFEAAVASQTVGQVGPPVQTEFGFHLIRVDERGEAAFEDVRDEVAAALADEVQNGFFEWFDGALAEAEVDVDPRYGTWDPTTASITRPDAAGDAEPTTTTLPGG